MSLLGTRYDQLQTLQLLNALMNGRAGSQAEQRVTVGCCRRQPNTEWEEQISRREEQRERETEVWRAGRVRRRLNWPGSYQEFGPVAEALGQRCTVRIWLVTWVAAELGSLGVTSRVLRQADRRTERLVGDR